MRSTTVRAAAALAITATAAVAATGPAQAAAPSAAPSALSTAAGSPAARTAQAAVAVDPFTDIATNPFRADIAWLAKQEVTSGWRVGSSYLYKPTEPIKRDQMAAFIYRMEGRPGFDLGQSTGFADVPVTAPFAKEIFYLRDMGYSTGYVVDGVRTYHPLESITRGQFAAFIYRMDAPEGFVAPSVSPFVDLKPGDPFYTQICYLADIGVTTGWPVAGGRQFRANEVVRRDTMAAFIHRYFGSVDDPTIGPRFNRSINTSMDLVFAIMDERDAAGLPPLEVTGTGFIDALLQSITLGETGTAPGLTGADRSFLTVDNLASKPDYDSLRSAQSLLTTWLADPAKRDVIQSTQGVYQAAGTYRTANSRWASAAGVWTVEPPMPTGVAGGRKAAVTARVKAAQADYEQAVAALR